MKQNKAIQAIHLDKILITGFILFFTYQAASTFLQIQSLKNMSAFYTRNKDVFAWSIILLEAAIAFLIFFRRTSIAGFVIAGLAGLSLVWIIYSTPGYPHNFGGLLNELSSITQYIIALTIIVLSALSVWVIYDHRRTARNL